MQPSSDFYITSPPGDLLKYTEWCPIEQWNQRTSKERASLKSYELIELRHLRDPRYEFLISKFKTGSKALFIAAKPGNRTLANVLFTEASKSTLEICPEARSRIKARWRRARRVASRPSLAIDLVSLIPDVDTFEDAFETLMTRELSCYPSTSSVSRTREHYGFVLQPDFEKTFTERRSTFSGIVSTTSTADTCWWDGSAINYTFYEKFDPPESDINQVEPIPESVKNDSPEEESSAESSGSSGSSESNESNESNDDKVCEPESPVEEMSPEYRELEIEIQTYLKHAEGVEQEINSIKLEIQRLAALTPSKPATQEVERKKKAELVMREADLELCVAQAEQAMWRMDIIRCEVVCAGCQNEFDGYLAKVKELEERLAESREP